MSQGGSQYDNDSLATEEAALNMIRSGNISMKYLTQVQDVLEKFDYGHFLVKLYSPLKWVLADMP